MVGLCASWDKCEIRETSRQSLSQFSIRPKSHLQPVSRYGLFSCLPLLRLTGKSGVCRWKGLKQGTYRFVVLSNVVDSKSLAALRLIQGFSQSVVIPLQLRASIESAPDFNEGLLLILRRNRDGWSGVAFKRREAAIAACGGDWRGCGYSIEAVR